MVSWVYYECGETDLLLISGLGFWFNAERGNQMVKLAGSCLWATIVARPLNAYICPGQAPREHH